MTLSSIIQRNLVLVTIILFLSSISSPLVYSQNPEALEIPKKPSFSSDVSNWTFTPTSGPAAENTEITVIGESFLSLLEETWIHSTVDTTGGNSNHALAIDSNGTMHISYYDSYNYKLKYANFFDLDQDGVISPSEISITSIDNCNCGTNPDLTLDSLGNVHISYHDWGNSDGHLKYASYNGSWNIYTVDYGNGLYDVGEYSSIAVDSNDQVHIAYTDRQYLFYASLDGNETWSSEQIVAIGGTNSVNSLVFDSNDEAQILWHDGDFGKLSHAKKSGNNWDITVVDGNDSSENFHGAGNSMVIDSNDKLHIAYGYQITDGSHYSKKYASFDGTTWTSMYLTNNSTDGRTSIAIDSNGHVHISYYHSCNGCIPKLIHAQYDGISWNHTQVNTQNMSNHDPPKYGWYSSLAVDTNGKVHLTYSKHQLTGNGWINSLIYSILPSNSQNNSNEISAQFGEYGNVTALVVDDSTITMFSPIGPLLGDTVEITLWSKDNTNHTLSSLYTFEILDSDGDGVADSVDLCEGYDDNIDHDFDSIPDDCDPLIDNDGDGISNSEDQCPGFDDNVDQDLDNIPDGCDPLVDNDNDGVANSEDQCPGFDDRIDHDDDNIPDNCDPLIDSDDDGVGDNMDAFPYDSDEQFDADEDGIGDNEDMFDDDPNEYIDSDGDGVGDFSDLCSGFDDNIDVDNDQIPDDCDSLIDSDGDGIEDSSDAFPNNSSEWVDSDGDGVGDNSDDFPNNPSLILDSDNDGIADQYDGCQGSDDAIDIDQDSIIDGCDPLIDSDGDSIADSQDRCQGYDDSIDVDDDLVPDACDALIDSDSDGFADQDDECQNHDDSVDLDGDGIPDGCDNLVSTGDPDLLFGAFGWIVITYVSVWILARKSHKDRFESLPDLESISMIGYETFDSERDLSTENHSSTAKGLRVLSSHKKEILFEINQNNDTERFRIISDGWTKPKIILIKANNERIYLTSSTIKQMMNQWDSDVPGFTTHKIEENVQITDYHPMANIIVVFKNTTLTGIHLVSVQIESNSPIGPISIKHKV